MASSYQYKLGLDLTVFTLFIKDCEHYTVLRNNEDLKLITVRTVCYRQKSPSWEKQLTPSRFHQLYVGPLALLRQDHLYSPSLIRSITEEDRGVAETDHKASYSVTLARRIAFNTPSTELRCIPQCVKYVNRSRNWNLSSYIDITDPLPTMVDLGYSLLTNPDLNIDNAINNNSHPDVKPILLRMVARCNRCFVIHIAADICIIFRGFATRT